MRAKRGDSAIKTVSDTMENRTTGRWRDDAAIKAKR